MQKVLVTGSSGLIGSEICAVFHARGYRVSNVEIPITYLPTKCSAS